MPTILNESVYNVLTITPNSYSTIMLEMMATLFKPLHPYWYQEQMTIKNILTANKHIKLPMISLSISFHQVLLKNMAI